MRIIAGRFKRRSLVGLKTDIRPTSDRLRGAVLNALNHRIQGAVFLDAMAGSGAMGLEALSRGAGHVIFNDRDRTARRLIEKNLRMCGVGDGYEILDLDVFVLLKRFQPAATPDILFFDPPYRFGRYPKLVQQLALSPLMGPQSVAVVESFKRTDLGPLPQELEQVNELTGGDSALRFFQRADGAAP